MNTALPRLSHQLLAPHTPIQKQQFNITNRLSNLMLVVAINLNYRFFAWAFKKNYTRAQGQASSMDMRKMARNHFQNGSRAIYQYVQCK